MVSSSARVSLRKVGRPWLQVAARGVAHAMFATGNSQLAFVESLLSPGRSVPWSDIVVFHMDEYVGVGPDHPAGFRHWIRQRIAEPARPRATHYLDGLAEPGAEGKYRLAGNQPCQNFRGESAALHQAVRSSFERPSH